MVVEELAGVVDLVPVTFVGSWGVGFDNDGSGPGVVGAFDVGGAHPGGEAGFEGVAADAVVGLAEDVDAVAGVFQVGAEGGGLHGKAAGVVPGLDAVDVLAAPVAGARRGALGRVAVGVAE